MLVKTNERHTGEVTPLADLGKLFVDAPKVTPRDSIAPIGDFLRFP